MKKLLSLTAVLTVMLAVFAVPALAQEVTEAPGSGGAIAVPYGETPPPAPPYFVYNGDGTVTIDGDTGSSCHDFALAYEQGFYRSGDADLAQDVLRQCEQAGALSSGSVTPPAAQEQYSQAQMVSTELPSTGGPSLPLSVTAVGTALLLGLGGIVMWSRQRRLARG